MRQATFIKILECVDCDNLHVQLCDEDGAPFAEGTISRDCYLKIADEIFAIATDSVRITH